MKTPVIHSVRKNKQEALPENFTRGPAFSRPRLEIYRANRSGINDNAMICATSPVALMYLAVHSTAWLRSGMLRAAVCTEKWRCIGRWNGSLACSHARCTCIGRINALEYTRPLHVGSVTPTLISLRRWCAHVKAAVRSRESAWRVTANFIRH